MQTIPIRPLMADSAAPLRPAIEAIGGGKLSDNHARLAAWRAGLNPGPLTIEVSLVHGCNHDCIHCGPQQFNPYDAHKSFLDADVFKRFLDEFREMGGVEVYFAGYGEPLLHPRFAEIMAHGTGIGLNMTFSSNGVTLNEANARRILPNTAWVRFSVNGGDAASYTRVHACPERDYHRLIKNLEFAAQLRDQEALPVKLAMQFVVFEANWTSLLEMVALHQHLGTDKLIFRNRINKEGFKHPVRPEALPLLKEADKVPGVEVRWGSFPQPGENRQAAWSRCSGVNFRTNMDHQGNLFACGRHFYKDSRFGDIHQRSFKEIWDSAERRALFEKIESGRDIPMCGRWCPTSFDNIYIEGYLRDEGQEQGAGAAGWSERDGPNAH